MKKIMMKLGVGAVIFLVVAVTFALTLRGAPPLPVYLVCGVVFAMCFGIAGKPLLLTGFRGRARVAVSYVISALGMGVCIYTLWLVFQFTAPNAGA